MCKLCVGSPEKSRFPAVQGVDTPEGITIAGDTGRVGGRVGGVGKHCVHKEGGQGTWEGPEASVERPVQGYRRD